MIFAKEQLGQKQKRRARLRRKSAGNKVGGGRVGLELSGRIGVDWGGLAAVTLGTLAPCCREGLRKHKENIITELYRPSRIPMRCIACESLIGCCYGNAQFKDKLPTNPVLHLTSLVVKQAGHPQVFFNAWLHQTRSIKTGRCRKFAFFRKDQQARAAHLWRVGS